MGEDFDALPKPYRSYRYGYVYRNEKPGPGRFRQFMQFDADTVGSSSPAADAEMCMMAADTMEALGIPRGSYVVKVNNRRVLDGVMDAVGLGGNANAEKRLAVLRAIDKLDRLGPEGVRQLLGAGRRDESGDFTKGDGLPLQSNTSIVSTITSLPFIVVQNEPNLNAHYSQSLQSRSWSVNEYHDSVKSNDFINSITSQALDELFADSIDL